MYSNFSISLIRDVFLILPWFVDIRFLLWIFRAIQETKEDRERKRAIMKEEIQILEADHKRLQENHSALLENLANGKPQFPFTSTWLLMEDLLKKN